ncbi:MAG: suppressor of fused domain protein [Candidatus Eisenbacteria bacterium]
MLITSGMSERPMPAPPGAENCRFAELLIALPLWWPLKKSAARKAGWLWPIRELRACARFPHAFDTWVWYGHTIQSSDAASYHRSVRFNSVALGPSYLVDPGLATLEVSPDRVVSFFALHFLYPEELQLKMRVGIDAVWDLFEKDGISEMVDPMRRNVCRPSSSPPRRGT